MNNLVDGKLLRKAFIGSCNFLISNQEEVNALNVFPVPDGDTGTNMSLTIKSAVKQINLLPEDANVEDVSSAATKGALMGARGNSGVILSQLFRGFSDSLKGKESIDVKDLARSFKSASDTTYKAVMKPTEGTILTVGREAADFALKKQKNYKDVFLFLEDIIKAANKSLDKTPDLLPVLKEAGVVDAGGKGLVYILEGALKALRDEVIDTIDDFDKQTNQNHKKTTSSKEQNIEFGYCTEFIINTDYNDIMAFREKLSPLGDSILVVGGEGSGLIKVHLHTNHPGKALEYAVELGSIQDIKIDNMRLQHEQLLFDDNEMKNISHKDEKPIETKVEVDKKYSFVAVSIGEGIDDIFNSLNVDYLVKGGQTMNPSTEDLLQGVESTSGENVFILPNNSNIILAAEQVQDLTQRNVIVIPTKSIPEGISALLSFNSEVDIETNKSNMMDMVSSVKSGQVTYAVRETQINGTDIHKDDIIGLTKKDIVSCGSSIDTVTTELIDKLIDEDSSLVSLYYGEGLKEEDTKELEEELINKYESLGIDIEFIYGGQPLYYYIVSIE